MNACKTKCESEVAKLLRCFFGFITGTLAQGIYRLVSVVDLALISRVEFLSACKVVVRSRWKEKVSSLCDFYLHCYSEGAEVFVVTV